MHLRRSLVLAPACALLAACPDAPATTSEGPGTSSTAATTDASTSATTRGPTTAVTTGPGTTAEPTTATTSTSDPLTSTSTASASWGSTSTTGLPDTTDTTDTSTTTGTPSTCGPPCPDAWEFFGDLNIWKDPGDFSCLTRVHGDLWIASDADPATVATLANLTRVDGRFELRGPETLADLSTFACLRELGALDVINLPLVTDLAPLADLRVAPEIVLQGLPISALPTFAPDFAGIHALTLQFNPALVDLGPASTWGLDGDGALEINLYGNDALHDLSGLAGLIAENAPNYTRVQVIAHPALTSLAGLEPMTSGDLYLAELPQLTDLEPLAQLVTAGGVTLIDLPLVTSLSGLGALTTVQWFMIGDCVNAGSGGMDGLTSLAGLDSLASVQSFALANNDNLASLAGAPQLTSVDGLEVVNNPALSQVAYDAFIAQLDAAPPGCFGGWDVCQCFQILPW